MHDVEKELITLRGTDVCNFFNIHGLTFGILCRRSKWEARGRQKSTEQTLESDN